MARSAFCAALLMLLATSMSTAFSQENETGNIAFVSRRNGIDEIYVIKARGSRPVKIAVGAAPAWSPDGTRIAYVAPDQKRDQVFVMDADGSNPARLTDVKTRAASPSWSPDGQRIAFVSFDDGRPEIYLMRADDSKSVRLTTNYGISPAWSPDGSRIAYVSAGEIYLIGIDGTDPRRISNNHILVLGTGTDDLAWSPDGQAIAFTFYVDGHDAVYRINADGSNLVRLTGHGDFNSRSPAWSPDGKRIVFSSYDQRGQDLFVMNADGSDLVKLTSGYVAYHPTWTAVGPR